MSIVLDENMDHFVNNVIDMANEQPPMEQTVREPLKIEKNMSKGNSWACPNSAFLRDTSAPSPDLGKYFSVFQPHMAKRIPSSLQNLDEPCRPPGFETYQGPKSITCLNSALALDGPCLKIQITGNASYDPQEGDLLNIFSEFGRILNVEVALHRTAYVTFSDISEAAAAMEALNGKFVPELNIKLYLSLMNNENLPPVVPTFTRSNWRQMSNPNPAPVKFQRNEPKPMPMPVINPEPISNSLTELDSNLPMFSYSLGKYTCKYDIEGAGDREFKMAQKIIGPKGCNMKKVIEMCKAHMKGSDIIYHNDFLKLRLRGRGSGYKEGPEQRESNDNLHLCVSSRFADVYELACKFVEDLLKGLYKDYSIFAQKAGRPLKNALQVKRIEIANTAENKLVEGVKAEAMAVRKGSKDSTTTRTNSHSSKGSKISNENSPNNHGSVSHLSDE